MLLLYIVSWLALAGILSLLLTIPGGISVTAAAVIVVPMMLLFAFVALSSYYVCRAFPLSAPPFSRPLISVSAAGIVSSAGWVGGGYGLASLLVAMRPGLTSIEWYRATMPVFLAIGTVLYLLTVAVTYLMMTIEGTRAAEKSALELQVLAREAELKALRTQINPHFLFNSLNSISALTSSDPGSARTMTIKLADFFRTTVAYGSLDMITLEQEITLTRQFLDIEQIRFGKRLAADITLAPEAAGCRVTPLLIQPLVENAVRHGIAGMIEGGRITVDGRRVDNRLIIVIDNPADPDRRRKSGTGVGLANVRRRIEGLYGTRGSLSIEDSPGRFLVRLNLPAEPSQP
jgi:two-component system, LytTR family, sensor histidine kinase AlgZ